MTDETPKDLGVKIGSEEEVFWKSIVTKCKTSNSNLEREILINNAILKFAIGKVADEKRKFKS